MKPAAVEKHSKDQSISLLLDLESGPLEDILGFLDMVTLAKTESVCRKLRQTISPRWDQLVEEILPPRGRGYAFWTAKRRVFRWIKASNYAKQMEWVASCHFDYDDHERGIPRCRGCTAMPDLDRNLWGVRTTYPPEFFIRLSYRKRNYEAELEAQDRVICQGFIEVNSGGRQCMCNLLDIYNREEIHWPEMEELLDLRDTNLEVFDSPEKVKKCFDNLALTVVAVEYARPWSCSLVVATGGLKAAHIGITGCSVYFQRRCFQSHGDIYGVALCCSSRIEFRRGRGSLVLILSLSH